MITVKHLEEKVVKKRKTFSWFFFILVFLFLLIIIPAVSASFYIKWALAAPSRSSQEQIFTIKENESTSSIAMRLKNAGLIKDANAFRIYTRISCNGVSISNPLSFFKKYSTEECLSGNVQAGTFKLNTSMDLPTLALALTKGRLDSWTKIIEGLRDEEIAPILEKNYAVREDDFLKEAKIGYMFPDTYLFKVNSTTKELVAKMRENFDSKLTLDLQSQIKAQGLTVEEGVILASIVQREAGKNSDAPLIASVFLNRLNINMPLGSDVTVQYALGFDQATKTWWKKDLTDQDLSINNPYNTRVVAGLPPGPICNPGLTALKAVAQPATSDNYYFLYGKDGNLHLAKTLAEHNANKLKYL